MSITESESSDIIWGARNIGAVLGLTERQAFYRLEAGDIGCARKIGAIWVARRSALLALFDKQDA